MEIKVGEYVRTKNGHIGKVIDISHITGQSRKKYLIKWNISKAYYITNITIIKNGKNIIDLIEVGDIVQVKDTHFLDEAKKYMFDIEMLEALKTDIKNNDLEILRILTHEQFEQKAYRLEKNNG